MVAERSVSRILLVSVVTVVAGFAGWGGGAVRVAAQDATTATDPCATILASATPVVGEGSDGSSVFSPSSPEQSGAVGNPADYPFDLVFIDAMTLQFRSAIAMSEIALVHGGRDEIRRLADEVLIREQRGIDRLQGWREAWYPGADVTPANVTTGLSDEGMMRSGAMGGMGQGTIAVDLAQAVAGLCQPEVPFDLAYLRTMITQHQGAVGMAQIALERAQHEELKGAAEGTVSILAAEVREMTAWEAEWYPSGIGTPAA